MNVLSVEQTKTLKLDLVVEYFHKYGYRTPKVSPNNIEIKISLQK
ncbi:hypothetical protein [Macrococcus epidermidis]|nr:hypothetical protein [Macrococcus epidermidis]